MSAKTRIRAKVASLIFKIALGTVIAVGVVTMSALWVLRGNTVDVSGRLGDMAAEDSKAALEAMATDQLVSLAENMAALSDAALRPVQNSVEMMAYKATHIMRHPYMHHPNPVPPPNPANDGVFSAQFVWATADSDTPAAAEEAARMGNIALLFSNIIANNADADAVYIGAESGFTIFFDENSGGKPPYADSTTRGWYLAAVQENGLIWTDVFSDAFGRGLAIVSAAPYHDAHGNIAGVAGAGTLLTSLVDIVIGTEIGEDGYAFILNERGQIIISESLEEDEAGNIVRDDLLNSPDPDMVSLALAMTRGESGIRRVYIDDDEYFVAFHPLAMLPWSLATIISVSEVMAPAVESGNRILNMTDSAVGDINRVILIVVVAFAAMLIVNMVAVSYASRRFSDALTRPITALQEGVAVIAGGNLDYEINITTNDEIEDLGVSVNKMAVDLKSYIANLRSVTAEKERIGAELDVAAKIQADMLPRLFPAFPSRDEFDIFASMLPAKEVGGDFYDFFFVDDNTLAVVMADVSGKGVPAALFMVIAKTLIKNNAQNGKRPEEVFTTVNNLLCENNEAGMFVTCILGYLDIPTGNFTYVNAGHNLPLLRRGETGAFEWLREKPGFILAGMEDMAYRPREITLHTGDELFLYTDGVTEAVNNENELFGDPRLQDSLNRAADESLGLFAATIKKDIDDFAEGAEQADDITMLVLKYKGGVQ